MKAIQFVGAKQMKVVEIDKPQSDGNRVLIEVAGCGICGSDLHMYENGDSEANNMQVPGHEFGGFVVDPGSREDLKIGDRVLGAFLNPCGKCYACEIGAYNACMQNNSHGTGLGKAYTGGMAEFVTVVPKFVFKLPDNVSFEEGSLVDPAAVALRAVKEAGVSLGHKVLITGAGPVGLFAAVFAKMAGATYVGITEASDIRLAKAKEVVEIDGVFDAKDPQCIPSLFGASGGGFHQSIECSGNGVALATCIYTTRAKGNVVMAGVSLADVTAPLVMALINEQCIKGTMGFTADEFQATIDLIACGRLDVKRFISGVVPFEGVEQAYEDLIEGKKGYIKMVLNPKL